MENLSGLYALGVAKSYVGLGLLTSHGLLDSPLSVHS